MRGIGRKSIVAAAALVLTACCGAAQAQVTPEIRAQIDAAEFGYETGRNSFQALIDAERSLRTLQIQYEDALANLGQRAAELDRARGVLPAIGNEGGRDEQQ